jgi:DNA polymerase elongation subunit (family B)
MKHTFKLTTCDIDTSDNKYIIYLFGIDEKRKTYSIKVCDMNPFFYVKVGENWVEDDCDDFIQDIIEQLTNNKMIKYNISDCNRDRELNKIEDQFDNDVSFELIDRRKLYGFDNNKKYQFIKFEFSKMSMFYQVKNLWYDFVGNKKNLTTYNFNDTDIELYEASIPTVLRFYHIKEISPCGWVSVNSDDNKMYSKETYCDFEFHLEMKHINSENSDKNIPYRICSFDIEASSSHGDFPLASKTYSKVANEIIDIWNKSDVSSSTDAEQKRTYCDLLLDAFSGGQTTDMSIIYTKKRIDMDEIKVTIEKSLTIEASTTPSHSSNSKKISEFYMSSEYEEDMASPYTYKKRYSTYIKKGTKILDILNNSKLSKDDKIEQMLLILRERNGFPSIEGDKTTFIGSTFWDVGGTKPYLSNCIVLGESSPVNDSEIISVETEKELLLRWRDLILREDPDIIIGYNIFGFDYGFLYERAKELYCVEDLIKLSRLKTHSCKLAEKEIQIASGTHELKYFEIPGRVSIDLYNYARREFNLESYKLDYVGGYFIGDNINSYENTEEMCVIKSKNLSGLQVGNYIKFEEIGHSVDSYLDGKKFVVEDVTTNTFTIKGTIHLDESKLSRWCLAKDDVTPQDIFRLTETGIPEDKAIIAKYCIQDCNLVHYILNKIDVITGLVEMANICFVPLSYLVMRGQGIKLLSYLSKKCMENGVLIQELNKTKGNEGFEGAIVLDPKCNLYLDIPVAVVDYSSLYPSTIYSENLSHDSKVWTKEYNLSGELIKESGSHEYDNLESYNYVDITFPTFIYKKSPTGRDEKVETGSKTCRFAQYPDEKKAIIPSILMELLNKRKLTKKMIKYKTVTLNNGDIFTGSINRNITHTIVTTKDNTKHSLDNNDIHSIEDTYNEFMKNILDKRQLAYKLTANSTYGGMGAKTSHFYEPDIAAATTQTGQKLLLYGKEVIERVYGNKLCETKYGKVRSKAEYIYGDTDSVFFTFNLETVDGAKIKGKEALKHTIELAKEAGELATKFLKKPHDLEYEKTFMPFCLLSKKRYVGMLYENDPDKCKRKSMGIVLKRRDNAPIVKDVYGGVIDILMKEQNINSAVQFVKKSLLDIANGKYHYSKFIVTKSLRGDYKNPLQIAHKVLADRIGQRDKGNKPKPGDRIPYIYFIQKKKTRMQGDKIETPQFMLDNKLKIDYEFYITNQIMKPIIQIFALVINDLPKFKGANMLKLKIRGLNRKALADVKTIQASESHTKKDIQEIYDKTEKKIGDIKNKEVKKIVFDDCLRIVKNERNGNTSINSFFK